MTETTTTTYFVHRTTKSFEYDFYGTQVLPKGSVLLRNKNGAVPPNYTICCGHGSYIHVPSSSVEIVKVTRKTTVETIEEKVK